MTIEKKFNLQNVFMILGFLLLVFAFIGPVFLDKKFAEYLGSAATPFVSAAAFLLLVSANVMQQKELTLQRKELKATKDVFIEQSRTMSKQRFENTFFNMISLNNEIVSSASVLFDNGTRNGRAGFLILYNRFRNLYNRPYPELMKKLEMIGVEKERVELIYQYFYAENDHHLAHYFKNLYSIMLWISNSEIGSTEKQEYFRILRAQLSTSEMQLLFYHITNENDQSFKELIVQYDVFGGQISPEDLIDEHHFSFLENK